MSVLATVRRVYGGLAILWLNTCVLLLIVNLAAVAFLGARRSVVRPMALPPVDVEPLRQVFPMLGPDDLEQLVRESARAVQYEPFTGFREKPFAGRYVNVRPEGFRVTKDQGAWPPDPAELAVFLFGGSTTFGMGVPDGDTIASYLQPRLARLVPGRTARVYNFGRVAYYSTQERILFEQLLTAGVSPDAAVFIDGLNDFQITTETPFMTSVLADLTERLQVATAHPYRTILESLPVTTALMRLGLVPVPQPGMDTVPGAPVPGQSAAVDDAVVSGVRRRYLANKRLIESAARTFGVSVMFVWQPVPTYKHDLAHHPRPVRVAPYARLGYPRMAALREGTDLGRDFVWCADIQEGVTEPLYVDQVHYSPAMSDRIATCIANGAKESGLLGRRGSASQD